MQDNLRKFDTDDDPSRNPSATTILVAIIAAATFLTVGMWMAVGW